MVICGVICAPFALWSREGAYASIRVYLRIVFWGLKTFCGLTAETRGPIPTGDVIVAAKHQSFLDILILCRVLPRPAFVMKRSLVFAPILGAYALRIGAAPVRRGGGREAVEEMVAEVARRGALNGQLVIFPQGTRVAPGVEAPYRTGAHHLYRAYRLPCVPAALNTGHFWPRRDVLRRPGVAVVEFLPPLPPDLPLDAFLAELEASIEPASDRLSAEAKTRFGV